jgi:hypothetical protein
MLRWRCLICKIALLEGELAEACRAREVAEEKFRSLFTTLANGVG